MSTIVTFVHDALLAGKTRDEIGSALHEAGWREDEVSTALENFAPVHFPIPVPRRKMGLNARDAFQHLIAFLTLYISSIALGTLLFQFVNLYFPDVTRSEYMDSHVNDTLRASAASLIIAFPIYLWITRVLQNAYRTDPERRASAVRKWLTYLTLFSASAVVIGYLIVLAYHFLEGALPVAFALKVVIVLAIAAGIFGFYTPGLRHEERQDFYELKPTT